MPNHDPHQIVGSADRWSSEAINQRHSDSIDLHIGWFVDGQTIEGVKVGGPAHHYWYSWPNSLITQLKLT